jgi:hypothetical protein
MDLIYGTSILYIIINRDKLFSRVTNMGNAKRLSGKLGDGWLDKKSLSLAGEVEDLISGSEHPMVAKIRKDKSHVWSSLITFAVPGELAAISRETSLLFLESASSGNRIFNTKKPESLDGTIAQLTSNLQKVDPSNFKNQVATANNDVLNIPGLMDPKVNHYGVLTPALNFIEDLKLAADQSLQDLSDFIADLEDKIKDKLLGADRGSNSWKLRTAKKALVKATEGTSLSGDLGAGIAVGFIVTEKTATHLAGLKALESVSAGTISSLTGKMVTGNLLQVLARQSTAIVAKFLSLTGAKLAQSLASVGVARLLVGSPLVMTGTGMAISSWIF